MFVKKVVFRIITIAVIAAASFACKTCDIDLAEEITESCVITETPEGTDPFYSKACLADGILIVGSDMVQDVVLEKVWEAVKAMLPGRPDLHRRMVCNGVKIAIVAESETFDDVPDKIPAGFEDTHYAAFANGTTQTAVVREKDLLCAVNANIGPSVMVHEFAHLIHSNMVSLDSTFHSSLVDAFLNRDMDLWDGKYGSTNDNEFWAETSEIWFNT